MSELVNSLRILHVSPYISPEMGGAPRIVYQMAAHLARRGHSVTILAGDYGLQSASFEESGFSTAVLPCPVARWGFYLTPDLHDWLRAHAGEYDLLHLHVARTYQNIFAARTAIRLRIPYLISAHGTLPIEGERRWAKWVYDRLFGRFIYPSAERWLAVSPAEVEQYREAGVPPEKIRLLLNGLDLAEFSRLPRRGRFRRDLRGAASTTKLILYLGRLHQRKGVDVLLRAFAQLSPEYPDSVLAIVGPDAGELKNLRNLAARLRMEDRVQFIGALYGRRRLEAMVDADVVAAPATREIFGLVPFEAVLCGTPVVVGDDGGSGQLIREAKGGYVVPCGDDRALATALRDVLHHPAAARTRVRTGREYVRRSMDWNSLVQDLEKIYREAVGDVRKFGGDR
jgi:glycosyltransferase involved in cell wall biosynthesis